MYVGTKERRGILYQKYYSLSRKFQSSGLLKSRYRLKSSTTLEPNEHLVSTGEIEIITEQILSDYEWLKNNKTPDQLVFQKWNNSFALRQKHKKENLDLFVEWPILKQRVGCQLVIVFKMLNFKKILIPIYF